MQKKNDDEEIQKRDTVTDMVKRYWNERGTNRIFADVIFAFTSILLTHNVIRDTRLSNHFNGWHKITACCGVGAIVLYRALEQKLGSLDVCVTLGLSIAIMALDGLLAKDDTDPEDGAVVGIDVSQVPWMSTKNTAPVDVKANSTPSAVVETKPAEPALGDIYDDPTDTETYFKRAVKTSSTKHGKLGKASRETKRSSLKQKIRTPSTGGTRYPIVKAQPNLSISRDAINQEVDRSIYEIATQRKPSFIRNGGTYKAATKSTVDNFKERIQVKGLGKEDTFVPTLDNGLTDLKVSVKDDMKNLGIEDNMKNIAISSINAIDESAQYLLSIDSDIA
jgi:hypothetical protein